MSDEPYFSSDWHLGHHNIMRFCPFSRMGSSVAEMSEMIIQNVIDTVPEGGTLWNLGDVSFYKYDETKRLLKRIKNHCYHHLVLGNHDNEDDLRSMGVFDTIQNYKELQIGKTGYILSHFPMRVWNKAHYGSYHLSGHSHSQYQTPGTGKWMDVGIDTRAAGDMKPYSLSEIRKCLQFETKSAHHGD